jgi:hypothetical protein
MTQIEVENNTPYRRRIFLHSAALSVNEPVPLMLAAWKRFDLGPGESVGAALGSLRIGASVASGSVLDHRTVAADIQIGDAWNFGLTNGIPALSSGDGARPGAVKVFNGLKGPNAAAVGFTFYRDYAPWAGLEVAPQFNSLFAFVNQMFAYASKPIAGGSSALVIEPIVGKFELTNEAIRLKLTPSTDGATVQWTSGVPQ